MRTNHRTNATPLLKVLSEDQIEDVYLAALQVLERTGTRIYHDEALTLLRNEGCQVTDGNLVRIPSWLVKSCLGTAPERVTIAGRDRTKRLTLEYNKVYFGTGSDCPFILDPYTNERRRYTFNDVYNAAKIAEALPNIDFHMSLGITSDVPVKSYDRHQLLAMLKGTTKPLVITAVDMNGLADQYEMACAALGGAEEFARAPLFVVYIEPSSPLSNSKEAVEKLLYAAEKGIPAIYTPCPMCGGTAPATLAGLMAQCLAENLTGVVLSQLKRKGAAVIIGGLVSIMDMSSTIMSYGAPEMSLLSAAMTEVTKWLRLPMFSTAGCSDSKVLDEQAAVEASISIAIAALSGANLVHDVGYLEAGLVGSFDMLVMSDEIISMVKRIVGGVVVDDEHLAIDVIDRVGPGGNFLSDDHTLKHFRTEFWFPKLIDRSRRETWEKHGAKSLGQRVREKVLELIERFDPPALPVEEKLKAICTRADKQYAKGEKALV
ncbi:MAG: trimethylamine methyltransferase family protein [Armatimonadetes bacterium]|nr:trimethylamine methyltransferase family protein [Armatimonadota bacterium]